MKLNDIAAPTAPAWKPEIGETLKGVVTYEGVSDRLSELSNNVERTLRIVVLPDDGEETTIYAIVNNNVEGGGYPKQIAKAIAAAGRAAGVDSIEVGGTLAVKRIDDKPPSAAGLSPQKIYVAEYAPPKNTGPTIDEDEGAVTGLI